MTLLDYLPLVRLWPWPDATAWEKRKLRGQRKALRRALRSKEGKRRLREGIDAAEANRELKRANRKHRRRESRLNHRATENANWRAWYRKHGRFPL